MKSLTLRSGASWLALWCILASLTTWNFLPEQDNAATYDWYDLVLAGRLAATGNPYAVPAPPTLARWQDFPQTPPIINLNAPPSLLFLEPLGIFNAHKSIWWARGLELIAICGAIAIAGWRSSRLGQAALIMTAVQYGVVGTLYEAQIYGLMAFTVAAAWWLAELRGQWLLSGLLIGLACAFKPNLLFVLLVLLLTGRIRLAASAAITFGTLWAISLGMYGARLLWQWHEAVADAVASPYSLLWSASLRTLFAFVGRPALYLPVAIVLCMITAALLRRYRPSLRMTLAASISAACVAAPVCWSGYSLFFLPLLLAEEIGILTSSWPKPSLCPDVAELVLRVMGRGFDRHNACRHAGLVGRRNVECEKGRRRPEHVWPVRDTPAFSHRR